MGDAEKIIELKKAYAEIILNTSKEAAARIMTAERKAFKFQSELSFVKEEGVQTLVRLKRIMDSKVREMEMRSLNQQKKIEELEAQLQEAEEIVEDLREELTTVKDELKLLKSSRSLAEGNLKHFDATPEEMPEVKKLDASGAIIGPRPDWQLEPLRDLAALSLKLHEATDDKPSTILSIHSKADGSTIQHSSDFQVDDHYVCHPDLTSNIMRAQKPEPSRNRCTLRVRAFERSLLDGNFSLPTQVDSVTKESIVNKEETIEDMHASGTVKAEAGSSCELEMTPSPSKEFLLPTNVSSSLTYTPNSSCRKKKRAVRCRKPQSFKHTQSFDFSCPQILPFPVERSVQHWKETSIASEKKVQNDLESNKDKGLSLQNGSAESSRTSASKLDLMINKLPSKLEDVICSDNVNSEISCQPVNDRIRYTFQRKRKRKSLGSPGAGASLEKNSLEKMNQTENDPAAPEISIIRKASRDRRRLAEVAHQLISLSEKKCWF